MRKLEVYRTVLKVQVILGTVLLNVLERVRLKKIIYCQLGSSNISENRFSMSRYLKVTSGEVLLVLPLSRSVP